MVNPDDTHEPRIAELLVRHLPGLRAFVRLRAGKVIRARESSCDLVQSVCREILQRAGQFQHGDEAGFRQWLYTTALRKIANRAEYYRAARRDAAREIGPQSDDELAACYQHVATPSQELISSRASSGSASNAASAAPTISACS
ncbi:MAG: hypothetical protein U1E76_17065 [Planctomycetota bacterium]